MYNSSFKVTELKEACKSAGIDTAGLVLIDRLNTYEESKRQEAALIGLDVENDEIVDVIIKQNWR